MVNGVDALAGEIVDSVVERLEADEMLAVMAEKNGINPDFKSSAVNTHYSTKTYMCLVITVGDVLLLLH